MPYDEKTAATLAVVKAMEDGLAANEMDMSVYFTPDFKWRGNQGSGTKNGIAEFQRNWQFPLRAAFTERDYITEHFMADGAWASCFGHIEATHSGTFMGIPATGKRVKIPYMDFWRVEDGRIAPGGELAVNTNGGGLSCVHPGMYGLFLIAEAVAQIRGGTGERQIEECYIALCHGNGGTLSSQCTAILGSEATL